MFPLLAGAQIGGRHAYDFLHLSPTARTAAIGGDNISTSDYDAGFAFQNPAILNDSMHHTVGLSITNYLSSITYGSATYARSWENIGSFFAGVQFLNYGKMIEADVFGNQLGTFTASDIALVVGGARKIELFSIGANLKLINSNVSGYRSFFAFAIDLGGLYTSTNGRFTAALSFQNIGFNLSNPAANSGAKMRIPFEVQAGISYKPEHMPLRFSVTSIQLDHPGLIYSDPDAAPEIDLNGDTIQPPKQTFDKIMRHFVFGGEFIFSPNFQLRFGYNHLRRQELRSAGRAGLAGFAFGFGIKIAGFQLDYALSNYHAIGNTHTFSVTKSISDFGKRKAAPL